MEEENKIKANPVPKNNFDTLSGSALYEITKDENNSQESQNNNKNSNNKNKISKICCDFICNKLFHSNKRSKKFYMKGWRDYLEREGNEASDKPFKILTNLFVNDEEAILGLESIRLNPNLVSENKLRNDLEFYIPQLCTFLLFGEMKDIEEFFVFLCKACNLSFFFAHRVHWFLSAMIEASQDKKENIIQILKMINTLFKSESEENKIKLNKFYVSNSEDFMHYVKINNLYFLYNNKNIQKERVDLIEEINTENLRGHQLDIYTKYTKSKELIYKYSEKEYEYVIFQDKNISNISNNINNNSDKIINKIETKENLVNEEKEKDLINFKKKLNANEFLISISNFKLNKIDYSYEDEDSDEENNINIIENENLDEGNNNKKEKIPKPVLDINFESYHSSLNFIDHLCDICSELTKYNIDFQKIFLYNKLLEINKKLPCNVYLPFLHESTRNYIICHIPLTGVKIFRTKTRCPIMLTFELIRIEEVNRANKEEENFPLIYFSYSKENDDFDRKMTLLEQKINSSYDKDTFANTDYDLSKPLMISKKSEEIKEKTQKKIQKNKYQSTNIKLFSFPGKAKTNLFNNVIDKDLEEDSKYFNYVNKFIKNPNQYNMDKIEDEKDKNKEKENNKNKKIFKSAIFNNKSKEEKILKKKLIDNEEMQEEIINIKNKKEKSKLKLNFSDNMQINTEEENEPISLDELKKIFGESFSKKEKDLKKSSIFGKLNTYKIFQCIIKTNEDLRQEQFATQLINEFYQIFK